MDVIEIGEVAARTGLSHRALRFYEARGLVRPVRGGNGRRLYGRGELARLNAVVALKRAGFSLAEIGRALAGRDADLFALVDAQLDDLDRRLAQLGAARALLQAVKSRIDRGEPIDVATLCSLIRTGGTTMAETDWKPVIDRYVTAEQQADWQSAAAMPPDFDPADYAERWRTLGARIEAALPLAPDSPRAQALVDDWFALLKPFSERATPGMWNATTAMYADRPNWPADADPGFSHAAWCLIQEAVRARRAAGGTVDGPDWMKG